MKRITRKDTPGFRLPQISITTNALCEILEGIDGTQISMEIGRSYDHEFIELEGIDDIVTHCHLIRTPLKVRAGTVELSISEHDAGISYKEEDYSIAKKAVRCIEGL